MANFAIITHGGRDAGTATGTYVVPPNVTLYFFTKDTELLHASASAIIEDNLLTAHPNELGVRNVAVEVKKAWDTVPNYKMTGDAAGSGFRFATGVYQVGQTPAAGPVVPVAPGVTRYLSDLIGGNTGKGAIGIHIYWLACRAAPTKFSGLSAGTEIVTQLHGSIMAGAQVAAPVKPSMVLASGNNWL